MDLDLAARVLTTPVLSDPSIRADGQAIAVTVSRASLPDDRRSSHIEVVGLDGSPLWRTDGPADRLGRFAPDGSLLAHVRGSTLRVLHSGGTEFLTVDVDGPVRRWGWRPDATAIVAVVERVADPDRPLVTRRAAYKRDGEGWAPSTFDLVIVDVGDGSVRHLLDQQSLLGDVGWTTAGDVVVCMPADDGSWRWDLVALDPTGVERWRTPHGPWDRAAAPLALTDGRVLYVGGPAGPDHARLMIADEQGCRPVPVDVDRNITVGAPAYPGAPPVIVDDDVLVTVNDDGCSRVCAVSLTDGSVRHLSPAGEVVSGLDARAGVVVTIVSTERSLCELRVGGTPIASTGDGLEPPWTVERLSVAAPDGRPVPAWVLRSRTNDGRGPLLLDIHGGPHNASNGTWGTSNLHRVLLAEAGWHVLLVNPRGSDGSGSDWFRGLEEHGGWASRDLDDLLAAVDAAVDAGIADPDQLAVTGYSYGGLATAALTTLTDRFRAAAMGGSLVDLRAFVATSDLGPRLTEREVGGVPWGDPAFDQRSPIRGVGAVTTPTLVFHGTADHRCPVSQAEAWYQALVDRGVPTELVLYPGAPHGFVTAGRPSWVLDVGRRIATWIVEHSRST